MDALECLTNRRSIRKFTNQPLTKATVNEIVRIASFAPSWKNTQTVRYYLVLDTAKKFQIAKNCVLGFTLNQHTIENAPALIILATIKGRSGYEKDGSFSTEQGTHWQSFDAGIAAQTFCLASHALGLGTVIMGVFDEKKVADVISLSPEEQVSALIAIGWPEGKQIMPKRKSVAELLTIVE